MKINASPGTASPISHGASCRSVCEHGHIGFDQRVLVSDSISADRYYFDTPDQALRKAGLSLRIRTLGKRRVQTLKAESVSAAGIFVRPEWEMRVGRNWPVIDDGEKRIGTLLDNFPPKECAAYLANSGYARS